MTSTRTRRLISAPRTRVDEALLDPAAVTMTIRLSDADGGTELVAVHEGLPAGLSPADNELGWREALARLAALVEAPAADDQVKP